MKGSDNMATIDNLDIQISASVRKATEAIDGLSRKIGQLSSSISGINTSGLSTLTSNVTKLSDAVSSFRSSDNFQNTIKSLKTLSQININSSSINNAANAINKISEAMNNMREIDFGDNPKKMANLVKSLSSINKIDDTGIKNATKAIGRIAGAMNRIRDMDFGDNAAKITELAKAISLLGNRSAVSAATNIPRLADAMKEFMTTMSTAPHVSRNLIDMTNAMAGFANAGSSSIRTANTLSVSITSMSKKITKIPNIMKGFNRNTINMSKGLGNLKGSILSAVGTIAGAIGAFDLLKSSVDISSSLTEVQNVVDSTFGDYTKKIEDFSKISIQQFGMSELTAKQMAGRFQAMGTAIGFSQGKMSDMSVELTKLAADMASFYNVEQDAAATSLQSIFTGETDPLRQYGIDLAQTTLEEWAHKQGIDAKMQSMSQMEKVMLRYKYVMESTIPVQGDFAKTRDTWANGVRILAQNFEILGSTIGGVVINVLKPFVKALNVIMGQVNEFAKTISTALGKIFGWTYEEGGDTGSNLAAGAVGAEDLSDSMDDVADSTDKATKKQKEFNKQLSKLDELINYTTSEKGGKDKDKDKDNGANLDDLEGLGGKYGEGKWKKTDSILKGYESELDSLYKLGDYIGQKLTKAMENIPWDSIYEKARNFGSGLASFLNGLISPELFSALGKTVAGSINTAINAALGFGGNFDFSNFGSSIASFINSALEGIDWGTALTAATTWGAGIAAALNSFLDEADFELIGKTVADFINTAVWGALAFANNFNFGGFGKKLAQMINSFIKRTDFNAVGELIAKFVNGAARAALMFAQNFNFKGVGKSIATFINSALGGIKWKTILTAASAWGKGIAQAINSFLKSTDFTLIGSTVGNFINTAINFALSAGKELDFKGIGQKIADGINGAFATIDFAGLAETINTWVKGALTTVVTLLQKTDFEAIGQKIGTFLAELDILSMMGQFAQMLWEAIKAGFSLLGGLIQEAPLETALIAAFAAFKFLGIGSVIGSAISSAISSALVTNLAGKLGVDLMADSSITSVLSTALTTKLAPAIKVVTDNIGTIATAVGTAVGAFAEFNVAKGAMENLTLGIENSTLGIGDFIAEIGKIGGAIALAVAAFTKALGQPAGTIIALIAGAVGAIKGIHDAFEKIEAETAMEAVADALRKPGGTPIEDLTKLYEDNINTIKSGFDGINEKSKTLEVTQNNAENTSKKIDLIKFAVENGSKATEENTVKIKDAFDSLLSDTESIFEQEYDIIMTGISGALSQSLIDAGYNVKEIVGVMDDLKDGHQKAIDDIKTKNEELSKSFEAGEITNEEYQTKLLENYEQLGKITGKTDEYTTSINKVSDAIKDVDLSSIVNEDNTINTEKLSGTFKQLSNTADDAKKSINESSEGLTSAIEDYRAEAERMGNSKAATILSDTLSLEKENVKKATDGVNGELTAYGEAVETALIEKIPAVIEEAKKKYGEKGFLYHSLHSESEEVEKAIEEYKKSTIEPTGKELEKLYSEAGVDWSSKASSATEGVLKSLFEPYNDNGVYTIAYDSLQGNYSDVIEKAVKEVSSTAGKGGKEITQTMSDSMPEGVDEKKAEEAGKKLTNKAKKSVDKKELKKSGKEGGKALSDGIPEGVDTKKAESAGKKVADEVVDTAIKQVKSKSKDIGGKAVDSTITGLDENWKKVEDWWKKAKMPEVKFTIEDIKSKVFAKWKEVTDWWGESRKLKVDTSFMTNENNVSSWWKKIKEWWGTKKLEVENSFKTTDSNVKSWWKKITDWWGTKKLEINSDFKTIQSEVNKWWTDKVKKWWGTKKLEVNSKFTTEKSTVVSWWTDKVKSWWGDRKVKVSTEYTTKQSTINGWGKDTVKWLKEGISGAWGDFSEWVVGKIKKVINQVVDGLNWVLKEVGSSKRINQYAKGSSGLPQDTIGLVNDQKGNTYREMIVPPHGKPFIPKGRNVTLPMEKGTKIMPAKQTKEFMDSMKNMPHFAKGIGSFTGEIFDYLDKPKEIIKIATDKFLDFSGLAKASLSVAKGVVKTLEDSSVGFIKKVFDSAGGGAGIERAISWALKIAADDSHGYDQDNRWGNPDYDCSSFIISAFEQAGIRLKSAGATYTGDIRDAALKTGFSDVTNSVNLSNGKGLKRGDILLDPGHHVALYIGDGQLVHASINENKKITGGQPGDQNGREILTRGYYNHPWSSILRYTGKSGDNKYAAGIGRINISDIVKGFAKGGLSKDELGVVNDQSGNTYKELIIPPHGTPFIPEGRNVTLAMEKGTRIIPADRTKKFLNSLPHFANGTEDFDGDKKPKGGNSIAAGVSQAINDTLMPYIKEIVRALKNGGGTTVTTSGKKTTTKYSDTVKEIQAAWLNLAKWFEDTVAKPIEKTFQTLKEQLLNVFDATNKELTEKYGEYATEWQDTLKEIPEWLKENVGDTIVEKFEELCSGLTEGLSGAWEEMQGILSSIPGWVESDVTSPFQGSFTSMFENIQGEHERLWGTIYSYSDKKLGELETRLGNINSSITSAKAEAESIQAEISSKTFDKITETITNTADTLSQTGGIQTAMQAVTGKTTAGKYIPSQTAKEEDKKEKTYHDSFVYWTPNKNTKKVNGNTYTVTSDVNETAKNAAQTVQNSVEKITTTINDALQKSNILSRLKVKRYATGGFPEDGWFRASKGEFMGQFDDGTSYVANNQQIQKAISAEVGGAVYNAVVAAMVNSNSNNGGDIVVNVDGESLFKIIKNKDNMMYNRTGKGAFEH